MTCENDRVGETKNKRGKWDWKKAEAWPEEKEYYDLAEE
jgi:hypothetical protein